jgi:hypothetical protein
MIFFNDKLLRLGSLQQPLLLYYEPLDYFDGEDIRLKIELRSAPIHSFFFLFFYGYAQLYYSS